MRTPSLPIPPYSHTPILLLAASLALAPAAARAANAVVTLADGRTVEASAVKPGAMPNQLVLEQQGMAPVTITNVDLLSLDFAKAPSAMLTPTVRLQNGDQISGKLSYPAARQVRIAAGWGSITVPLTQIAAMRFGEAPLPGAVSKDTLYFQNDRVEAEVQSIANGKVTVNLGGKAVPLDIGTRVQSVALAPRKAATADTGGAGLLLSIDLGGGERLTGHWVKLTPDLLSVKMEWGDTLDIPLGSIARLEVKNGKLVYLSDMKPSEARQIPYLDGSFPFRVNQSVAGRPLRLAGRVYRRGLGTHSKSDLTYTLDGGYASFAATLGIDDAVGSAGSVIYRVYGDEKLLYESPVVRGGDIPLDVKVDVKRVLLLRLEVDYADGGDVADHADWADARLLRP